MTVLRRRTTRTATLLAPVEEPSGHVRVMRDDTRPTSSAEPGAGWSVLDGNGELVLEALSSRAEALRSLGGLAMKGAELPLTVLRPDGLPTGDHLA
jgi:hypothetical protein